MEALQEVEGLKDYGQPGDSIQSFLDDPHFIRVLIGGRGSGKTNALATDIVAHLWQNAGGKAIVARETEVSQADSSIDTFWIYFNSLSSPLYSASGLGLFKSWNDGRTFRVPSKLAITQMQVDCKGKDKQFVTKWIDEVGDKLCGYIEFRGLPDADKGKFRGMECSYLALIEADQIAKKQFDLSLACLRWKGTDPSTCDEMGFIKDRCVVLDSNPPGTQHWIAKMEATEAQKSDSQMRFWHIPTSENEHNLPANYIRDTILLPYEGNSAMIERMLFGRYADAFDGSPVFYAYRRDRHEATGLKWPKGAKMVVPMDVGTNNYSLICSHVIFKGHAYFWALREIFLTGSDTDRQCIELLKVLSNEFPFWNRGGDICPEVLFCSDPAARNSSFTKAGPTSSALKVMQSHGIYPAMKTGQRLQPTIAMVNRVFQQMHASEDGQKQIWHFKIDTERCPLLANACRGEYRYPSRDEPGYGNDQPLKGSLCNHADHRADGLRYGLLHVFDIAPENHDPAMRSKQNVVVNPEPRRSI